MAGENCVVLSHICCSPEFGQLIAACYECGGHRLRAWQHIEQVTGEVREWYGVCIRAHDTVGRPQTALAEMRIERPVYGDGLTILAAAIDTEECVLAWSIWSRTRAVMFDQPRGYTLATVDTRNRTLGAVGRSVHRHGLASASFGAERTEEVDIPTHQIMIDKAGILVSQCAGPLASSIGSAALDDEIRY